MAPLQPAPQIHGSRTLLKFLRVIADFGSDFSVPCAVIPNVVQEIQLEFQHFYFALQGEGRHGAEPMYNGKEPAEPMYNGKEPPIV